MPGNWTKRGKDSYRLQVSMGTDFKGDPIRYTKTVHCKSDAQADKELAKFYAECEAGNVNKATNVTLEAFCDEWMRLNIEGKVKKSTLVAYESMIKNHIKPNIGQFKLSKLTVKIIQEWVSNLSNEHGLSPKSVNSRFSLLHSMLGVAHKWGYLKSNPSDMVELPPVRKKEASYYTKDEVIVILEKLSRLGDDELKYRAAIILTLFSGLRMGELMGLKWSDIDMDGAELKIYRTRIYRPKFGVYEDTPKTERSARKLSITTESVALLRRLKVRQAELKLKYGTKWIDTADYVFHGRMGGAMFPPRVSAWWREFQEREGVRKITFHQLRHTHTSLLAYMNIDKTQISRRLGHSQLTTTMNIYTHLFEDTDRQIADKLNDFYTNFTPTDEKQVKSR